MDNKSNSSDKRNRRIIIGIIIIIIILLLITSCSAIKYFGKVGRTTKEANVHLNNNNEKEIVKNKNLIFDLENTHSCLTIKLQDGSYKLGYSVVGIKPGKYSCTTSDAKIATCAVKDGYILIKPKKRGNVTISLSTDANGKKYVAEVEVEVRGYGKSGSSDNGSKPSGNKGKKTTTSDKIVDSGDHVKPVSKEHDARLKRLRVDNYNLAPTFNPDVYEYVVAVPNTTTTVNISAVTNSSKATIISGVGDVTLTGDSTIVRVRVRAEDGTTKTYTIKINKSNNPSVLSTDSTLRQLSATGYGLTPVFNSNTHNYTVTVPYNVRSLDLTAIANDEHALVSVSGNSNFNVGNNNVVRIRVTAEDGSHTDYTITVNRLDQEHVNTNADLQSLEIDGYTLSPAFDKDTVNYTINVDSNVNSLNITAIPDVSSSNVTIMGNSNFTAGENNVVIKVRSQDGVEKDYIVKVIKAEDNTSTLTSLSVRNYPFNETFSENTLNYTVTVPHTVDDLEVLYTKKDSRETVEITGNTGLLPGENTIRVRVTAEDGTTTTTYRIIVTKEENLADFYITSLKSFKVGYKAGATTNYKNVIINSNILNGTITATKTGNNIRLDDGNGSYITLTSSNLDLEYITDDSGATTFAIKANYDHAGNNQKITVTGNRKGHEIDSYDITFNVVETFTVTIDANGGSFNAFSNKYELEFYDGEELDLSVYNEAYKYADLTTCTSYKFIGYDEDSTKTSNATYPATYDSTSKTYSLNSQITVDRDMTLYAIYDPTDATVIHKNKHRIYLAEVDIFELEDGTKGFIYPGTEGSYIMHIENTTDSRLTITGMKIEETNICVNGKCVNVGYIARQYTNEGGTPNYKYLLGSSGNYHILSAGSTTTSGRNYEHEITFADSDKIVLEANSTSEAEITLLWKWVDSSWDTSIGDYVANNPTDNKYYLTVSFVYETEDHTCEVDD